MVKLSRTSLAFFTLAVLPALFSLATNGSGSCAAFFAGGDFLDTGRVTVFIVAVVVALAAGGPRLLAGFVAAGAVVLVDLGRAGGLALVAAVVPVAGVTDSILVGLLVSSATLTLL